MVLDIEGRSAKRGSQTSFHFLEMAQGPFRDIMGRICDKDVEVELAGEL
jgi:hypothetical protein